jgi:hypothetical protein
VTTAPWLGRSSGTSTPDPARVPTASERSVTTRNLRLGRITSDDPRRRAPFRRRRPDRDRDPTRSPGPSRGRLRRAARRRPRRAVERPPPDRSADAWPGRWRRRPTTPRRQTRAESSQPLLRPGTTCAGVPRGLSAHHQRSRRIPAAPGLRRPAGTSPPPAVHSRLRPRMFVNGSVTENQSSMCKLSSNASVWCSAISAMQPGLHEALHLQSRGQGFGFPSPPPASLQPRRARS